MDDARSTFKRGYDLGIGEALSLLATEEALTGNRNEAVCIALRCLRDSAVAGRSSEPNCPAPKEGE